MTAQTIPGPVPEREARASSVAKAKAIAPDVTANLGSTPKTTFRGNPDIFGRLVEDHDRHRALFAMIEATEGKSPERVRLFTELTLELKSHAAAEEQALWSSVLRDPETTTIARHAISEHKQLDELLADLAARDMGSSGWLKRFDGLKVVFLDHIKEEEQEQFLAAEQHLGKADIRYMRKVFERRKKAERAATKVERKINLKA